MMRKLPSKGIIVGADQQQEWLLPWWWKCYRSCNRYPVTFFDFGLSDKAKQWCQKRGDLIPIDAPPHFVKTREEIDPIRVVVWEFFNPRFWAARPLWFLKPLALAKTPYDLTLWLDLDCQVCKSLIPLMETFPPFFDIGLRALSSKSMQYNLLLKFIQPGQNAFNAGVILYPKQSLAIKEWAKRAVTDNGLHLGDQELLTTLLWEKKIPVFELDPRYNWEPLKEGIRNDAYILHWIGKGKKLLRQVIASTKGLESF